MEMENDEEKIGKVEKGFEFIAKAKILYLHLEGDALMGQPCTHHFPRDSHGDLLQKEITWVLDIDETDNPWRILHSSHLQPMKQGTMYKNVDLSITGRRLKWA